MAKKINKNNMVRYIAMGALGVSLFGCAGLNVYDAKVDHTEEICLICKLESTMAYIDNQIGTVGAIHQMKEMKKDYQDKEMDVEVVYDSNYRDNIKSDLLTKLPKVEIGSSGINYTAPTGYKLVELDGDYYAIPPDCTPKLVDGEWYGVKKSITYTSNEKSKAIIAYEKNPETGLYDEEINAIKVGK